MPTTDLYSTVRNTSGSDMTFSYLGKHGKTLSAGGELTVWGHLQHSFGHGEAAVRKRKAFERDLNSGRLTVLKTPKTVYYDTNVAARYETISSVAQSTTTITVVTAVPHGLTTNNAVTITGLPTTNATVGAMNGTWPVASVTDSVTFTATVTASATLSTTTVASGKAAVAVKNPTTTATVAAGAASNSGFAVGEKYYFAYSHVNAYGETVAGGTSAQYTVGGADGNKAIVVTVPALPTGAVSTNVYMSKESGANTLTDMRLVLTGVTGTTATINTKGYVGLQTYPATGTAGGIAPVTVNTTAPSAIIVPTVFNGAMGITDVSMGRYVS